MARMFIDCEFNGGGGALISMALITEDGNRHFYEVVDLTEPLDPWVKDNVMPILDKDAVKYTVFQQRLKQFLSQFPGVHVVADHPSDIVYLCKALTISGGDWIEIQPLTFELDAAISAKASKVPHNAFHDAVALKDSWLQYNGFLQA